MPTLIFFIFLVRPPWPLPFRSWRRIPIPGYLLPLLFPGVFRADGLFVFLSGFFGARPAVFLAVFPALTCFVFFTPFFANFAAGFLAGLAAFLTCLAAFFAAGRGAGRITTESAAPARGTGAPFVSASRQPCASRTAIMAERISFQVCCFFITSLGNMQPSQQM